MDTHRAHVATRSGELSYLEVGEGPTALFLHGVGTGAALWWPAMTALADESRCVAPDLPLHGRSPARDDQDFSLDGLAAVVEDFCLALDLDVVDLVANDTGGAIAQVFAVRQPRRLRSLTLTNCDVHDNLPPESFRPTVEAARRGELAPIGRQVVAKPQLARQGAFGNGFQHPERLTDSDVLTFLEPVFSTERAARLFERLLTELDAADLIAIEPQLKQLDVPTLLVWGNADEFFELRWAHWLHDTLPRVMDLVEVDEAKLFFPVERPDDFVPHLRKFWHR